MGAVRDQAAPYHDEAQMARAKQRILELRAQGYSGAYCASHAGIARRTLYHWLEADPVLADAWQDANECHHDWYEDRLRDRASGADTVAIIVGLKMAGRFTEKGGGLDPAETGRAILEAMRQIVSESRRQLPIAATSAPVLTVDSALSVPVDDGEGSPAR